MLDEESVKEGKVCEPKTWDGLDWEWLRSVPTWYFVYWSRLDLYRSATFMTQRPINTLTEDDVMKANCVWDAKNSKLSAFGVKDLDFSLVLDDEKRVVFGEDRQTLVFSDNKSYIFGATDWADGQQSWGLWMTEKELTNDLKEKALSHAKQLGFDTKLAVETKFTD